MPRGRRTDEGSTRSASPPLDTAAIDALYGLEPVIEPDAPAVGDGATPWVALECPYCWEHYDTQLDLSAGSSNYVEDCQVCCRPIQVSVAVDDAGALQSVRSERMD